MYCLPPPLVAGPRHASRTHPTLLCCMTLALPLCPEIYQLCRKVRRYLTHPWPCVIKDVHIDIVLLLCIGGMNGRWRVSAPSTCEGLSLPKEGWFIPNTQRDIYNTDVVTSSCHHYLFLECPDLEQRWECPSVQRNIQVYSSVRCSGPSCQQHARNWMPNFQHCCSCSCNAAPQQGNKCSPYLEESSLTALPLQNVVYTLLIRLHQCWKVG